MQDQLAGGGQIQRPVVEAGALPVLAKDHIGFLRQPAAAQLTRFCCKSRARSRSGMAVFRVLLVAAFS